MGAKLFDQFQPGNDAGRRPVPYTGWVEQMTGYAPSVAQALLPYPQYCGNIYDKRECGNRRTFLAGQLEKRSPRASCMLAFLHLGEKNIRTPTARRVHVVLERQRRVHLAF